MSRALHLVTLLLVAVVAGCATRLDVVVDEGHDLSTYRTWNFAPGSGSTVDGPHGDAADLNTSLARLIEDRLRESGFERSDDGAEFFVRYQLSLRNRSVVVNQPRATYQLDSHHSQGSFVVEGSERVTRVYTEIQLAVEATEARGRTLWHAELSRQVEPGFALELDDAVDAVMDRFPQHQPGEGEKPSPSRGSDCDGETATPEPPADPGASSDAEGSEAKPPPETRCPETDVDAEPPRPVPRRESSRLPA